MTIYKMKFFKRAGPDGAHCDNPHLEAETGGS